MPGLPCTFVAPASSPFSSLAHSLTLYPLASIDLDECIAQLYKKNLLAESLIEAICAKAKELLMKESNVVHISAPVTVVGDIHGQFFDMIEIFKIGGFCPDTNYLFLGESGLEDATSYLAPLGGAPQLNMLSRRLCRSRSVQRRDHFSLGVPEATIPVPSPSDPWQP